MGDNVSQFQTSLRASSPIWASAVSRANFFCGQMPHRVAVQKTSNPPSTSDYIFKNFPMRQIVYSNVNILLNTTEISKVSESCLTEVCLFQ